MNRKILYSALAITLLFAAPALAATPAGATVASGLYAAFWKGTYFGSPMAAWPACTPENTPPAGVPSSTAPTATEIDPNIAHGVSTGFYWDESSTPGFGSGTGTGFTVGTTTFLNTDFSVEWTGYIWLTTGTTYYFQLNSDDGSWLYINTTQGSSTISAANLVLNDGGVHASGLSDSGPITVASTGYYAIEVDYYETCDSQSGIDLSWSTGSPANMIIIPTTAFTPAQIGSNAPPLSSPVPQFGLVAPLVAAAGFLALALLRRKTLARVGTGT
jgi:hypothetical protein